MSCYSGYFSTQYLWAFFLPNIDDCAEWLPGNFSIQNDVFVWISHFFIDMEPLLLLKCLLSYSRGFWVDSIHLFLIGILAWFHLCLFYSTHLRVVSRYTTVTTMDVFRLADLLMYGEKCFLSTFIACIVYLYDEHWFFFYIRLFSVNFVGHLIQRLRQFLELPVGSLLLR